LVSNCKFYVLPLSYRVAWQYPLDHYVAEPPSDGWSCLLTFITSRVRCVLHHLHHGGHHHLLCTSHTSALIQPGIKRCHTVDMQLGPGLTQASRAQLYKIIKFNAPPLTPPYLCTKQPLSIFIPGSGGSRTAKYRAG
jgi:hypothetical protein